MSKRWYVVHAYSGFEATVKRSLEERIERAGVQELFGDILVPTEEVVEMRGGTQRRSERKFFPGYVLVPEISDELTEQLNYSVTQIDDENGIIQLSWEKASISFSFAVSE